MCNTRPTLVVFVGSHGSGKSTLGRLTADALGWRFDEELGETLRLEALARDSGAHAARPQEAFDQEVFRQELARDLERMDTPRVVETWHPGNLAYALKRSPRVALEAWCELKARLLPLRARVLILPLEVAEECLIERLREPGPDAAKFVPWLLEVGRMAQEAAEWLGLEVAPPMRTDLLTVEEAVREVVARVIGRTAVENESA